MAAAMLRGGPECCGLLTAGGTESLVMSVKTYRDRATAEKGVRYPEMVVPITAHAAFDKASKYLGVKVLDVMLLCVCVCVFC
jgi:sphinganine-1-phosphate aldolase